VDSVKDQVSDIEEERGPAEDEQYAGYAPAEPVLIFY
jgi:hypothetical protein